MTIEMKAPDFNQDFFNPATANEVACLFSYKRNEIRHFIEHLGWFLESHPITKNVSDLLQTLITFRGVTDERIFSSLTDERIQRVFNETAAAIKANEALTKTLDKNTADYQFLMGAIAYSKTSIQQKIKTLLHSHEPLIKKHLAATALFAIVG